MKYISLRYYFSRSKNLSVFFFICLILSQMFYLTWYKEDSKVWLCPYLIAVVLSLLFLWLCRFEMRTVTKSEQRFLGYKGYILFLIKLLSLFVFTAVSLIISANYKDAYNVPENIMTVLWISMIVVLAVYLILYIAFLFPYRRKMPYVSLIICFMPYSFLFLFKSDKDYEILTINYHKKIKDWKAEGLID